MQSSEDAKLTVSSQCIGESPERKVQVVNDVTDISYMAKLISDEVP